MSDLKMDMVEPKRSILMNVIDNGKNNLVLSEDYPGVTVRFDGDNNRLNINNCLEKNLSNLNVSFVGDSPVVSINEVRKIGKLRVVAKNGGGVSIGRKTSIEEAYFLADSSKIEIGQDCMISFQVNMRTTDAHGIYDLNSGKLLNCPGTIKIEDHVWLGQGVLVSSNVVVRDNCVIGARSYLRNCIIDKNSIAVGTPARVIRDQIIWDRRMTSNFLADDANIDSELMNWIVSDED